MAVGGVAYAAGSSAAKSGSREREQEQRLRELEAQQAQQSMPPQQAPQAAPPPAAPSPAAAGKSTIDQLKELGQLRDSGILTPAEFEAQKAKVLAG